MSSDPQVTAKKPYQQPSLRIYGKIDALTAAVLSTGTLDGGGGTMVRTA